MKLTNHAPNSMIADSLNFLIVILSFLFCFYLFVNKGLIENTGMNIVIPEYIIKNYPP